VFFLESYSFRKKKYAIKKRKPISYCRADVFYKELFLTKICYQSKKKIRKSKLPLLSHDAFWPFPKKNPKKIVSFLDEGDIVAF